MPPFFSLQQAAALLDDIDAPFQSGNFTEVFDILFESINCQAKAVESLLEERSLALENIDEMRRLIEKVRPAIGQPESEKTLTEVAGLLLNAAEHQRRSISHAFDMHGIN